MRIFRNNFDGSNPWTNYRDVVTSDMTGNVAVGGELSNVGGWNKVISNTGVPHSKIITRATTGDIRTGVYSHSNWNGQRGLLGTESNHDLSLITNSVPHLTINKAGNVGVGTLTPAAKLDVNGGNDGIRVTNNTNEGPRLRLVNTAKTATGQTQDWSIWNMTGGYGNKLSFWRYNGDGANAGSAMDILDSGEVIIPGGIYSRKMNNMYYNNEAIIYDDIFTALNRVIFKNGNPVGWNQTHPVWNGKRILNIGNADNNFPNTLRVVVPAGNSVIWVRILNDRWSIFKLFDANGNILGRYGSGHRRLNNYMPNGGTHESFHNFHLWMPIPLNTLTGGTFHLASGSGGNGHDCWISGIAFSKNPWNHAMNSAVMYHWAVNGGGAIPWSTENWNNDQLARFDNGNTYTIRVPIVPSGRDKLLYFIEHNNNWNASTYGWIQVKNMTNNTFVDVERLRTTYDNPFARHHNSAKYQRYLALIIPSSFIRPNDRFIDVTFSMGGMNSNFHIREIGTHDLY
jgi:hypothetical protein